MPFLRTSDADVATEKDGYNSNAENQKSRIERRRRPRNAFSLPPKKKKNECDLDNPAPTTGGASYRLKIVEVKASVRHNNEESKEGILQDENPVVASEHIELGLVRYSSLESNTSGQRDPPQRRLSFFRRISSNPNSRCTDNSHPIPGKEKSHTHSVNSYITDHDEKTQNIPTKRVEKASKEKKKATGSAVVNCNNKQVNQDEQKTGRLPPSEKKMNKRPEQKNQQKAQQQQSNRLYSESAVSGAFRWRLPGLRRSSSADQVTLARALKENHGEFHNTITSNKSDTNRYVFVEHGITSQPRQKQKQGSFRKNGIKNNKVIGSAKTKVLGPPQSERKSNNRLPPRSNSLTKKLEPKAKGVVRGNSKLDKTQPNVTSSSPATADTIPSVSTTTTSTNSSYQNQLRGASELSELHHLGNNRYQQRGEKQSHQNHRGSRKNNALASNESSNRDSCLACPQVTLPPPGPNHRRVISNPNMTSLRWKAVDSLADDDESVWTSLVSAESLDHDVDPVPCKEEESLELPQPAKTNLTPFPELVGEPAFQESTEALSSPCQQVNECQKPQRDDSQLDDIKLEAKKRPSSISFEKIRNKPRPKSALLTQKKSRPKSDSRDGESVLTEGSISRHFTVLQEIGDYFIELTACPFSRPITSIGNNDDYSGVNSKTKEMLDLELRMQETQECRELLACGNDDDTELDHMDDDDLSGMVSNGSPQSSLHSGSFQQSFELNDV